MNPFKTFFYSLKKSLFEPKYYQDIAKTNFWFSYKYLWFLLIILTLIKAITLAGTYIAFRPQIQPLVNKNLVYVNNFYPNNLELKIENGQLSTNAPEPYTFDAGQKLSKHLLIIDTKGSIENYPQYNAYILATKNAVVYPSKSSNGRTEETSVFYFKELNSNFVFNRALYDSILNKIKPYSLKATSIADSISASLFIFFVLFGSIFWQGSIMTGLFFLTLIIWVISLIFKKGYNYWTLYRLGMHAVTWPIIIGEVLKYINFPIPNLYSTVYLIFMVIVLFS